jgi:hypothetical protein
MHKASSVSNLIYASATADEQLNSNQLHANIFTLKILLFLYDYNQVLRISRSLHPD